MSELVTYKSDSEIATVTMDDGKANAFSLDMLAELHGAIDQAESEGAVIVLRGREGRFSAGFDLKVFQEQPQRIGEMVESGARLAERLLSHSRPVLAACTGHAVAAGAFVLLSCDSRIGIDGPFRIGLNEVAIGLTVPLFVVELARRRLTPAAFDQSVITAAMFDPASAVSAGFLDHAIGAEDFEDAVATEAGRLASLPAEAHAATKGRARNADLEVIRKAIEREMTGNG
ncbi:MAG: crotonase/enoyl-CoA hydratase family protein [Solirubrobacterales bacterium]|nr:crotonase/enoyl-CoA hydratase family protein [Solirubrobacterales bacterium]MCB0861195.1 crotonase/enoyl-CoA hydratase family protein [Solirubrobacterales bacterium]HRV60382.1 crotonase/enoyl-CoA hydratase family protein [Solirubrobacterales bacterium]